MSGAESRRTGLLLVLTAGISWGLLGIFVRRLMALGLPAPDVAALRSLGAALVLTVFFVLTRRETFRVRLRDLWCMAGCGIVSITFFNVCYFAALRLTTVNIAVTLLYTSPAFVMVMSVLFFREKLTLRKAGALAAVLLGSALAGGVFSSSGPLDGRVLFWGLGSGFCYALYTIFGRCAQTRGYGSAAITLWTFLFSGAAGLFIPNWSAAFRTAQSGGGAFWTGLAGMVLISTILPYGAYTAGLKRLTPSTSAIAAAVEPLVGTVMGVLVFHESLTFSAGAGMVLILGAVFLCRD